MKKIVVLLLIVFALGFFNLAKANLGQDIKNTLNEATQLQQQVENAQDATKQIQAQAQEKWQQVLEQKCGYVESRIDLRIARYENNQKKHSDVYNQSLKNLNNLVVEWKAQGKDTTKLESDLQEFKNKIDKFKQDYESFINKMRELRGLVCGDGQGSFAQTLLDAKQLLEIVHQDVLDIRLYYQQTIRPDLQSLESTN